MKAKRPVAPLVSEIMEQSFGNATENLGIALQVWRNEPGAKSLHQVRVELRRFRVLLRIFADKLEACEHDELVGLLRESGDRLGVLRDFDVMLALCRGCDDPVRDKVIAMMEVERKKQVRKVRAWMSRSELERTARDFTARLTAYAGDPGQDESSQVFYRRKLRRQTRRILQSTALAKSKDSDKLHAFRKKLRRLRYLGEAMAANGDSCYNEVVASVHACEQRLGKLHDLDMILIWVQQRFETDKTSGLETDWMHKRQKRLKQFRRAWKAARQELEAI